jgi:hypothetical protein
MRTLRRALGGKLGMTAWHDGLWGAPNARDGIDPAITGIDRSHYPLSVFSIPSLRIVIISQ